jgi:alanine dehydrogenase
VDQLSLGVVSRSQKENERRLAIHPLHVQRVDAGLGERVYLEHGYGERFGVPDEQLASCVAGFRTREEILTECDVVLLPKPQPQDLAMMGDGQVLWGWPHCVQDEEITQLSIERRLTLIAFEAMNYWNADGSFGLHVFHKNNELAGYCSVLHALELIGTTGEYGRRLRAAVISFGATGRGAVTALSAYGVNDVDVLTHRDINAVASQINSARMVHFEQDAGDPSRCYMLRGNGRVPLAAFLAEHDIVVNCVLQDTDAPLMFVTTGELGTFARGSLIAEPMVTVGNNVSYYAVDHSPSHLWNSATWEISEALLPYLRPVLSGPQGWDADETIRRAIEIRGGVIRNPRILSFQHRSPDYPHPPRPQERRV